MLKYDKGTNTLIAFKVDEPELKLDLFADQRDSYYNYLNSKLEKDMDYLCEVMAELLQVKSVSVKTQVGEVYTSGYKREIKKQYDRYYPIMATFKINGAEQPPIEILRVPYLDQNGILNVAGERRILTMRLLNSEDVSYNSKNSTLSVAMPERNISFIATKNKGIEIKFGKNVSVPMPMLISAMLIEAGMDFDISKKYSNAYLLSTMGINPLTRQETIVGEIQKINIIPTYAGDKYRLGSTREALNSVLSIDRCLTKTLSRKTLHYDEGTLITQEVLQELKRNLVNEVYVRAIPNIAGYRVTRDFHIDTIPAGTPNGEFLREVLPEYKLHSFIPESVSVSVHVDGSATLTDSDIQFLYDIGMKSVECRKTASAPSRDYFFEQEIMGNYTCKLRDVWGTDIPEGRASDEYVYYFNNAALAPSNCQNLTVHDLMAIYSLTGLIYMNPEENDLLHKDFNFLKRVALISDTFSETLREAIPNFVKKYKTSINKAANKTGITFDTFRGLSKAWYGLMWKKKYTTMASTINPIATLAQVNHVSTDIGDREPPEEMRLLAMGYYGRICPYETPSSDKLGITNTKAIGARIRNGLLETPYQRVIKNNRGEITGISPVLTWMTVREESRYKIGDKMELVKENGKYVNTSTIARVPTAGNQVTVETIDSFHLEYVNAFCEQHLSPTAMLIPFACSDDAVRVTYATNMLKQSILVQGSEVPRVYTSMYKDCFNNSNTFLIRAKKDGFVAEIPPGRIILAYNDGTEEEIEIAETSVTSESVNFLNFKVKVDQYFKAGDILVDSAISKEGIYSPGVNVFTAWLPDGWNYEDAKEIAESAATKFTSISAETVRQQIRRSSGQSVRVGRENYYRYIPEDGVVASINKIDKSDVRRESVDSIMSGKSSGILYSIERSMDEKKNTEYKCQLLGFNKLHEGDKMSGRHSDKGTVSIVKPDSQMPIFNNGVPIEVCVNPCGVPSRMNIGQNFEGFLGFVATLLDIRIQSNPFNGASHQEICMLMKYVYDLANTPNAQSVCPKYPSIPEEVHAIAKARHSSIREWENCFYPDGTAALWNPETGKYLENPVTFGVTYMLKLEHEVDDKVHARAGLLEEEYSMVTKQPTEGSSRGGGQKMGEMELGALIAYGAQAYLEETTNEGSDNVTEKVNQTLRSLGMLDKVTTGKSGPVSVDQLRYLLEVAGVKMVDTEQELTDISRDASRNKVTLDVRQLLAKKASSDVFDMRSALRGLHDDED